MEETDRKSKNDDNWKAFEDDDPLALCLSPPSHRPKPPTPPPPLLPRFSGPQQRSSPPPPPPLLFPDFISIHSAAASITATTAATSGDPPARPARARRNPSQAPSDAHKSDTVSPPFPWATDLRTTILSLDHLLSQNITNITGEAQCKRCEASQVISYDLVSKFNEVEAFIRAKKHLMHDRAPAQWMSPAFPDCLSCG